MLWTDLFTVNGVALRVVDADTIGMEGMEPVGVVRLERALRRRDLERVLSWETPGLLVAESIGMRLRRDLEAADWSWIDEHDEQGVVLPLGGLVLDDEDPDVRRAPRSEPAAWPRGRSAFAIVRSLLLAPAPSRQSDLVNSTGYSQPLVSRTLNRLRDDGLVVQAHEGWAASDWLDLAQWWIARYRGPGGVVLRLATTIEPWSAARQILEAAQSANVTVAFSGAIAADATAPWTEPASVVCYARGHLELDDTDLVESADPQASVQIIVAADDSVWSHISAPTVALLEGPVPVTDSLQTAWHIRTEDGRSSEDQMAWVLNHARGNTGAAREVRKSPGFLNRAS